MEQNGDNHKCWVAILYDWGDGGLTIARTSDLEVLRLVKRRVLSEARRRLEISREMDEVMTILDQTELSRLKNTLDLLIPEGGDKDF